MAVAMLLDLLDLHGSVLSTKGGGTENIFSTSSVCFESVQTLTEMLTVIDSTWWNQSGGM